MTPFTCSHVEAELAAQLASPTDTLPAALAGHLVDCDHCMQLARELEKPVVAEALADATAGADFVELTTVPRDHYVRVGEIGRGGMGRIVRARDRRLGRSVAIKELLDERLRERFEREARLTARLQHPAIVGVHEAGRWPSGEPFFAMKYVAGRPLDQVIAGARTLAERLALFPHFVTVVEAVAYAHSERVIHRDLKPHNILVGPFGETVVIDWGLAKELGAKAGDPAVYRDALGVFTIGGAGTPAYMAPEQARGDDPDERVDVFGLGATLHHLLAGAPPGAVALGDEVPAELRAIVARASAPDRDARYRTAAELADELRRYQTGQARRGAPVPDERAHPTLRATPPRRRCALGPLLRPGGRVNWTTWDDTGRKRSEGQYYEAFWHRELVRFGVWTFWNTAGDATTFDFGCPVPIGCPATTSKP